MKGWKNWIVGFMRSIISALCKHAPVSSMVELPGKSSMSLQHRLRRIRVG